MTSNLSTKKTLNPQYKELTHNLKPIFVIIGVVAIIGATAPFWHIFFDRNSTTKVFGFFNLQAFLYSFGTYLALFTCASFIFWIKHFIAKEHTHIKRIINIVAGCFMFTASYFIIWIFYPQKDLPKEAYYVTLVISAIAMSIAVYLASNFVVKFFLNYKTGLKIAVEWILDVRSKIVPRFAFMAHDKTTTEREIEYHLNKFSAENDDILKDISKKL